jgi:hypothetical protein
VQFPCKYLAKGYPVAYEEVFYETNKCPSVYIPKYPNDRFKPIYQVVLS